MKPTKKQQAALVRFFQEHRGGLAIDGDFGPKTSNALDRYIQECVAAENEHWTVLDDIFESVRRDVGQKEVPLGSNMGPYVEGLRAETGLVRRGGGEWCALLQSAHFLRYGIDIRHRGAGGVVRELAKIGRWVEDSEITEGFVGLSQHPRGTRNNHVRIFRVYAKNGKLYAHWIGGNEKHRVKEGHNLLKTYLKDTKKVSTL